MYRLPPAGGFLETSTLIRGYLALSNEMRSNSPSILKQLKLSSAHTFTTNSGKASLFAIFSAVKKLTNKTVVGLPSYTCPDIAAAAVRAGLQVQPLEQRFESLDFDLDYLKAEDTSEIGVVVLPNLFGLVDDLEGLRPAFSDDTIFIDDACQGFFSAEDTAVGFRDDTIGLLSSGRGKTLCGVGGSQCWLNRNASSNLAAIFEESKKIALSFAEPSSFEQLNKFFQSLVLPVLEHPRIFWIPASIPSLQIGQPVCDYTFEPSKILKAQFVVAKLQLQRRVQTEQLIEKNALLWRNELQSSQIIHPAFEREKKKKLKMRLIRYPLLIPDIDKRERIYRLLSDSGLGPSLSYRRTLSNFDEIESGLLASKSPEAERIAESLITLPVHSGLSVKSAATILELFRKESLI